MVGEVKKKKKLKFILLKGNYWIYEYQLKEIIVGLLIDDPFAVEISLKKKKNDNIRYLLTTLKETLCIR